jgi:hypothetical protein
VDSKVGFLQSLESDYLMKGNKACLDRGLPIIRFGVGNDFSRPAKEQDAVHEQMHSGRPRRHERPTRMPA